VVEILLGVWLAVSPWALSVHPGSGWQLAIDLAGGLLAVGLAAASFCRPTRRAHLLTLAVAAVLVGWGWARATSVPFSPAQNDILVGLTLLMFAVIPVNTSVPPEGWRKRLGEGPAT
jgi:hypothetical protein